MATTPGIGAAEVASDAARLQKLEEQLDPEMQFRPLTPRAGWLVAGLLLALSCFHYYTAGFGLLPLVSYPRTDSIALPALQSIADPRFPLRWRQ